MKNKLIGLLQKLLGFENFLFYFSRLKIYMLNHNSYEKGFTNFMNMIPDGDVILDIGANIGITAIPLAKKFPKSIIHAFEPIPQNASTITRVIKSLKIDNVVVHRTGLGNEESELKMVLPVMENAKKQGLSHVYKQGDNSDWNHGEIFIVPQHKLDNMGVLNDAKKISAIKIDVENFEYEVLKGAANLLAKHKPIIYCELWENEVRPQVINYLKQFGYEPKVFNGDDLIPYNGVSDNNFIFTTWPAN